VAAESLHDELMALQGVAEAQVDEADGAPTGVRVRLLPDADARMVGAEVQRVLAAHGMRSRLTSGDDADATPPAPGADGADGNTGGEAPADDEATAPSPLAVGEPVPGTPSMPPVVPPPVTASSESTAVGLARLRVEEGFDDVVVTAAASDGREATERCRPDEEAMFAAIARAVGSLADGAPPEVLAVGRTRAAGSEAMTVLLERSGGDRAAGAALTRAGAPFAVARAVWAALRET
jgi:hypothetical protein